MILVNLIRSISRSSIESIQISSPTMNSNTNVSSPQIPSVQTQHCQHPIKRNLLKTFRNNLHLKCLTLTLLTGTCLLAMCWCSFASFTKVMLNLHSLSLNRKRREHSCDQAYFYTPFVFVVTFYILYLIECFHSETRFSIRHLESSDLVEKEIEKHRNSLPMIWWKALNYHYLRKTRLITRYRNGEAFTSTQVYFQRVNSRITSTCYVYDIGNNFDSSDVIDISKKVVDLDKFPLTKIKLSKGFAFSNVQAANDFERQRCHFFNSCEQVDDFLEMREGMDLANSRFRDSIFCVSSRKPWYVKEYAFWLFSFLLFSWPFRLFLNYKTGYLNYQIIKLFDHNIENQPLEMNSSNQLNNELNNLNNETEELFNICSLPPSYSQAMLWPPTYNYIKKLISKQNSSDHVNDQFESNSNNNLDLKDKYKNLINDETNRLNTTKLQSTDEHITCNLPSSSIKTNLPSSLSCSFLNGQLVYLVNTLKQSDNTLIENNLKSNTQNNKQTNQFAFSLNANNQVKIIDENSLHEINDCNNLFKYDNLITSNNNLMFKAYKSFLPKSKTIENIPYIKQFSNCLKQKFKSMQNLNKSHSSQLNLDYV